MALDLDLEAEPFATFELDAVAPEREILGGAAFAGLTAAEQKALAITSTLETGRRGGFDGLSGDFDGMGISFGLVNWNIGAGSLQPLLRDFAREFPDRWRAVFGRDAQAFLTLVTPKDAASQRAQLDFAKREMNEHGPKGPQVREPWVTYFRRLADDPEFQRIQVRYVRDLLDRARYFCDYFALKSERAYCFMFDAVSSHGKWWLTKKFDGVERRRLMLREKLDALAQAHAGRSPSERETLTAVAEVLRATSRPKWAEMAYERKLWFLTGKHRRQRELVGLEPSDAPFTTSTTSVSAIATADTALLDAAIFTAWFGGARSHGGLADSVFLTRHPERAGRRIASGEAAAIHEWRTIRDRARVLFPQLAASGSGELQAELAGAGTDAASAAIRRAIAGGTRDRNRLADVAFDALHPERRGAPIARGDTASARQWRTLRDTVVADALGPTPSPPQTDAIAGGTTIYLDLRLGDEGPAPGRTGVFVPSGMPAAPQVDVILYLHGHKQGHYRDGAKMAIDRYWAASTRPRAPVREALAAAHKQAIVVAPTLGPFSQANALVAAGGLDGYLARVLAGLVGRSSWTRAPSLRNLVIAAHSGGGIWMLRIAQSKERAVVDHLRECWGFDCFYNPRIESTAWPAWARANPDRRLIAVFATDACEGRVCYGPITVATKLAKAGLANMIMHRARRADHFATVQDHLSQRISEASFLASSP